MRIAVAMSGGLDSSMAAILLKEQGHDIVGITAKILLCADMDGAEPRFDVCCSPEQIRSAKTLAGLYGFPHLVLDMEEDFSSEIIDPFCREYLNGRTPSPCIHCNARIKFKRLAEFARSLGYEKLATGHYARIRRSPGGRFYVCTGLDTEKDQSYFLFSIPQEVLGDTVFPLGERTKKEMRTLAAEKGLQLAERPESQELCFVLDNDYPRYIERRTGIKPPPGDIIDTSGRVLGRHRGIHRYTIGQRRGIGVSSEKPLYVTGIDAARNTIVAGHRDALLKNGLVAEQIAYMKETRLDGVMASIKTRSTQTPFRGRLEEKNGGVIVHFAEAQSCISPGQAAVFYDDEGGVLAGGWIVRGF